ncbi:hypothetical protein [Bartonella raoultii]|uniref:hypothetical protein n=1 Tax=Bartonella raoultii TaxID=1457020 RepID=UPI001ABB2F01|nr:hypothetical protein [Bartonella raoultii]
MGSSSASNDSSSNSQPHSWLFPEEDDCSAGTYSQATGAGGIVGGILGGFAGAIGGIFSGPGGVSSGFVNEATGGGLAGAAAGFIDKYEQCLP